MLFFLLGFVEHATYIIVVDCFFVVSTKACVYLPLFRFESDQI